KSSRRGAVMFLSLIFLSFYWQDPAHVSALIVLGGRHRPRVLPGGAPSLLPVVACIRLRSFLLWEPGTNESAHFARVGVRAVVVPDGAGGRFTAIDDRIGPQSPGAPGHE